MRFLSSSVICFAMSAFLSLRLPPSPVRARGRREVVGAHDTEQPGFAKVNAPSFPREGYGVCHHSPSLRLTLLCLLLIAEVTTPNRVRLLPQSTPRKKPRKIFAEPLAPRGAFWYITHPLRRTGLIPAARREIFDSGGASRTRSRGSRGGSLRKGRGTQEHGKLVVMPGAAKAAPLKLTLIFLRV